MKSKAYASSLLIVVSILVLGVGTVFSQNVSFLSDDAYLKDGAFLENVPQPSKVYNFANISRTLLNEHWVKNKDGFILRCQGKDLDKDEIYEYEFKVK